METIDNKYLIVIKSDGAIETIKSGEKDFDIQSKVLDLLERGSTVILNGEYQNDDLNRLIDPTYMFFSNTFKSFEQLSFSLDLFEYYNKKINVCYNFYDENTKRLNYALKGVTKEKLEEEKRRLSIAHDLEYISKKALILIYPDGKVESVPETLNIFDGDDLHLYYYTKIYEKSATLRGLLTDFRPYQKNNNDVSHNYIDNELVVKETIVMLNQDVGVELENRTQPLSEYRILLPRNYGSVLQTEKVEEILRLYPEHRMNLGRWNDEVKRCTSTYLTDVQEDIALKKELIRKEGK